MYAIIANGGKQYKVSEGQVVKFESLSAEEGQQVDFPKVLLISDGEQQHIGTPSIAGASVDGEVVMHGRGKKVEILKFKRRKHHMKRMGHRQNFTAVKITAIHLDGDKAADDSK